MHPIRNRAARRAAPLTLLSLLSLLSFFALPPVASAREIPGSGPVAGPDYAAFAEGQEEGMPDSLKYPPVAPTNTLNGTRGLSQTPAAEALGAGRLVMGISGPWYRQAKASDRKRGAGLGR